MTFGYHPHVGFSYRKRSETVRNPPEADVFSPAGNRIGLPPDICVTSAYMTEFICFFRRSAAFE
jgi:hypothetical protein